MINLAISNIAWNNEQNEEVFSLMQNYGFTGLEIAPTKIFPSEPYSLKKDALEWADDLHKKQGFYVPSMQSIWYGRTEKLFGSEEERKLLLEYTKKAIDFAASVGAKNLVFGCPKNRQIPDGSDDTIAVSFFKETGDYAAHKGTCIGMEANPDIYGTNFVNTTVEAIDLIKRVCSDGFKLNLDVGTMIHNNEDVSILQDCVSLINHVHISEPFLKKIEKRDLHKELFNFLRTENYDGFISIEMGLQEQISDIEHVLQYIKEL